MVVGYSAVDTIVHPDQMDRIVWPLVGGLRVSGRRSLVKGIQDKFVFREPLHSRYLYK